MMRTVLSIGHNKGMNHVINTIVPHAYQILVSDNVFYGMHLLKNHPGITLVIIDVDTQPRESLEFIRHISSSKVYNKPCIVISGTNNRAEIEKSIQAELHDHFVKPFDPMALVKSIGRLGLFKKNDVFKPDTRRAGPAPDHL